ncbi:MAG: PilZ domain-containing protein [Pyrinomonadaceae bacterium]
MLEESSLENSPRFRERRSSERSRLIVEIYFAGEDATGVAHTRDISLNGLYMNTQHHLSEGDLIKIRIPFHSGSVVVNSEVVYSNAGHGVGLRFLQMADADRALLERELPVP